MLKYLLDKSEVVGTAEGLRAAYHARKSRRVIAGPFAWLGNLLLARSVAQEKATLKTISPQEQHSYIPRDMALSLLQARHEEYMESQRSAELADATPPTAMGSRIYTGTWTFTGPAFMDGIEWGRGFDYHFITGFLSSLSRHFLRRVIFRLPRSSPQPYRLSDHTRLVIVGDWGTGEGVALEVADQMRLCIQENSDREVHVIHLGDVYYAGTRWEATSRFLSPWPVDRDANSIVRSWCLNGNHDMYSAGEGLFKEILADNRFRHQVTRTGEATTEFVLSNDNWTIAGLDTSWKFRPSDVRGGQGRLGRRQRRHLRTLGRGTRLMLLTHHQPITLAADGTVLEETELMTATASLRQDPGIDAWFWGHEHRLVCYGSYPGIGYATCTGHGAVLEEPASARTAADRVHRPLEYTDTFVDPDQFRWRMPGFTVVDIDGRQASVTYIDKDGRRWRDADQL